MPAALMLNGTKGMERHFSIPPPSSWSEKVAEREVRSIRMDVYPAGKGKIFISYQNSGSLGLFCLMLFQIFLLQSRLSTIPISLPEIGVFKYHVPQSCAPSKFSHWAGSRSHGEGMTSPGAGTKWEQAESFPVSLSSLVVSPIWVPFSRMHEQTTEGKGIGKVICIPTLHLKAINYG